jgi:hypothetical protein
LEHFWNNDQRIDDSNIGAHAGDTGEPKWKCHRLYIVAAKFFIQIFSLIKRFVS